MTKDFSIGLEQVQLLIDRIQNHKMDDFKHNRIKYEKLLTMSEKISYTYGQAVAHVCIARYHGTVKNEEGYRFNIEKAWEFGRSRNYLDIQIECYKAEALHFVQLHDEIQAMGMCVGGLKLAIQVKDQSSTMEFYYHIGEIFDRSKDYDIAERFYKKAADELKLMPEKKTTLYRKGILLKMTNLAITQGKAIQAREYYQQSTQIDCGAGTIALGSAACQIRLLITENKEEEAKDRARDLINVLKVTSVDESLQRTTYLLLMESLISLSMVEEANWCMGQINRLYLNSREDISIQKLRIALAQLTGEGEDEAYEQFFAITMKNQRINKISTANSFKNLIDLAQTSKKNTRVMEQCNDLQAAINTDELTGVSNRRYFSKLISKLLQDESITAISHIMVDVDHFKEYNDFYGHIKGDEVLVAVAGILEDCLLEDSYVARYGGDEFSCLLINKTEQESVDFVEAVQKGILELHIPHRASKVAEAVTLSFGIYNETSVKNISEEALIDKADQALYQAKKQSRNCFAIYS